VCLDFEPVGARAVGDLMTFRSVRLAAGKQFQHVAENVLHRQE